MKKLFLVFRSADAQENTGGEQPEALGSQNKPALPDIANPPPSLPPGITQEMIDAAKAKHGPNKVKLADVPLDDDGNEFLTVLIAVPPRATLGEFEKYSDKQPIKAKEILINACLLSHKDKVKADDNLFFSVVGAIADIIPIRKASIKNC